jgi:FtsZ-binding cell division protein ZapB
VAFLISASLFEKAMSQTAEAASGNAPDPQPAAEPSREYLVTEYEELADEYEALLDEQNTLKEKRNSLKREIKYVRERQEQLSTLLAAKPPRPPPPDPGPHNPV